MSALEGLHFPWRGARCHQRGGRDPVGFRAQQARLSGLPPPAGSREASGELCDSSEPRFSGPRSGASVDIHITHPAPGLPTRPCHRCVWSTRMSDALRASGVFHGGLARWRHCTRRGRPCAAESQRPCARRAAVGPPSVSGTTRACSVFVFCVSGAAQVAGDGQVHYTPLSGFRCLWGYHLVGLVWTSEFVLACQQMTVAGAVVACYFNR